MPVDQPTGGSDIIGDAASRRKQVRVSRILGMRDMVQPQGPQDAQSIISRMAGAAKPKTANDPSRDSQFTPNEGKALLQCRSCGPQVLSLGQKGFPSSFGKDDEKKPDDPVDAAKPFGKPKDDSTAAKPDAAAKPAGNTTTGPCPTCGQASSITYGAPQQMAPPMGGAPPPANDGASQPQAPRDVGQGQGAPNFPGHGLPGTQGPNANVQPPPGNSTPPPGQPAVQAVGPAQNVLQLVMQLPVDQLDPIKRAIDSRMAVVRSPLPVPQTVENPVDATRSNYGQKTLEDGDKNLHLATIAHFAWKHRDALAAIGYTIVKRAEHRA